MAKYKSIMVKTILQEFYDSLTGPWSLLQGIAQTVLGNMAFTRCLLGSQG